MYVEERALVAVMGVKHWKNAEKYTGDILGTQWKTIGSLYALLMIVLHLYVRDEQTLAQ